MGRKVVGGRRLIGGPRCGGCVWDGGTRGARGGGEGVRSPQASALTYIYIVTHLVVLAGG